MKKKLFIYPAVAAMLVACGSGTTVNNDALNTVMETNDDFQEATVSFEDGGATNGEEYFFGVQAEVVEIDVKFREVDVLDEEDAAPEEFYAIYDTMIVMIADCKKAMDLYNGKGWPKQKELQELTIEWVNGVQDLVDNYLRDLAVPMSIPDEEWSDKDMKLYEKYAEAYDKYLEVDGRWVDFQYEYAAANNFELSDETIDADALVEEDLKNSGH